METDVIQKNLSLTIKKNGKGIHVTIYSITKKGTAEHIRRNYCIKIDVMHFSNYVYHPLSMVFAGKEGSNDMQF